MALPARFAPASPGLHIIINLQREDQGQAGHRPVHEHQQRRLKVARTLLDFRHMQQPFVDHIWIQVILTHFAFACNV